MHKNKKGKFFFKKMKKEKKLEIQRKGGEEFVCVKGACIGTVKDILRQYLENAKNDPCFMREENGLRTRMFDILEGKVNPTLKEIQLLLEHEEVL